MSLTLDQTAALIDAAQCAIVDLIESTAQTLIDDPESPLAVFVSAQGAQYLKDADGEELEIEDFPDLVQAMGIWDSYFQSYPGVYLVPPKDKPEPVWCDALGPR